MDDNEIVDLYLIRDERAISESSNKYGRQLSNLSKKIVLDMGTAEECINDTWLNTWNSIPPHEPRDWLFAYLAKITRALSIDAVRKMTAGKRNANVVPITSELSEILKYSETVEQQIDEMLLKESLNKFLSGIEREKRDMFVRRYWYIDSIADIAKRHDCSESRVKVILHRLRRKLDEWLRRDGIILD